VCGGDGCAGVFYRCRLAERTRRGARADGVFDPEVGDFVGNHRAWASMRSFRVMTPRTT